MPGFLSPHSDEAVTALAQFGARSGWKRRRSLPSARGGHLLEGLVFPTLEVVVTETPAELRKVMRPDLGIALIDLDRSES